MIDWGATLGCFAAGAIMAIAAPIIGSTHLSERMLLGLTAMLVIYLLLHGMHARF